MIIIKNTYNLQHRNPILKFHHISKGRIIVGCFSYNTWTFIICQTVLFLVAFVILFEKWWMIYEINPKAEMSTISLNNNDPALGGAACEGFVSWGENRWEGMIIY